MKKIVVFTGAGVSAESGIATFRTGPDGLWLNHKVEDVATITGWKKDRELVQNFYNTLRVKLKDVEPNAAHLALAKLQDKYDLTVITQNVDDLHERGGVYNVLHLHGELTKARSTVDPSLVYDIGYRNITSDDKCEKGSRLRPHIVWFGEGVPNINKAVKLIGDADIVIICGTSLQVYPAASLISYVDANSDLYIVDPEVPEHFRAAFTEVYEKKASEGMVELVERLLKEAEEA